MEKRHVWKAFFLSAIVLSFGIIKDFIEAYDKEKKGRGKGGHKRGEPIPWDGSGEFSKGIRESNSAVCFAGVVYRKDA